MENMLKTIAAAAIITAAFLQPASATVLKYQATLTAAAENNPLDLSTGTGMAFVTLDTIAQTMEVQITYSGLTSAATGAHIHCCLASPFATGNAGVATTTPAFPFFVLGATSGSYDQVINMLLPSSYNMGAGQFLAQNGGSPATAEATLFQAIVNGETYLNIHTSVNPGGEIRGFLVASPVPEPATIALLGAGISGFCAIRRRKTAKRA